MHASIVRIVADGSGGCRFEDVVDTLIPADFAPPAPPLDGRPPRGHDGDGHATHVLPGEDWVAFVVAVE